MKTGEIPTIQAARRGLRIARRQPAPRLGYSIRGDSGLSAWRRRFGSKRSAVLGERVRLDVVQSAALAQTIAAFVLLVVLVLATRHGEPFPLFELAALLTLIVLYSGVAYWSIARFERLNYGSLLLTCGDGLALILLWVLLGPRSDLALLLPIIFCIGIIVLDTAVIVGLATGLILTYLILSILSIHAGRQPPLTLAPPWDQLVPVVLTVGGLALTLAGLLVIKHLFDRETQRSAQEAADLDELRLRASQRSRQFIADLAQFHHILDQALMGNYRLRLHCSDSDLRPIALGLNQLLERLEQLSQDGQRAEEIEAAVQELAQMVELARSGRPWTWPRPSNTIVDHLVDVLRRPAARRSL
jgi:hypothetical protein